MTARPARLLVPLLVAVLLAGCSSSSRDASSGAASSGSAPAIGSGAAEPALAGPAAPADASDLQLARDVVRTASLEVQVPDLRAAADRARGLAETAGGGLESEDASADADVLRLRVAPERLAETLDRLAGMGRETSRKVGSENVAGQVADLESRLTTQRVSVERVRALLAKAQALADVVALESQLTQRETALESLQARAKALQSTADLATVTLTLTTPPPAAAAASAADFGSGLSSGVHALLVAARGAAVVLGAVLPFLPLLLVAGYVAFRVRRRAVAG